MKKKIHINQHKIRSNNKLMVAGARSNDELEPVITVKTYKSNDYGYKVMIHGDSSVVYSPNKPLPCGARVWVETEAPVTLWKGNALGMEEIK